jgi:hypothetical protein
MDPRGSGPATGAFGGGGQHLELPAIPESLTVGTIVEWSADEIRAHAEMLCRRADTREGGMSHG